MIGLLHPAKALNEQILNAKGYDPIRTSPFHTTILASRLIRRSYKAKREVKSKKDEL